MTGNHITDTSEIAEAEWDAHEEPEDVRSDIVATVEPEERGIEFHVSMRDYTQRDMEGLIIEAAAMQILGRRSDSGLAKAIEAKCIELVDAKASSALAAVTAEIIEQPLTPSFGSKEPVTMREFIGLTGRAYLTTRVGHDGKPSTRDSWARNDDPTRIERLVSQYMDQAFKKEIEKATNAAINEVRAAIKAQHDAFLAAERARLQEALAKAVQP
jgi:hypothetical protein